MKKGYIKFWINWNLASELHLEFWTLSLGHACVLNCQYSEHQNYFATNWIDLNLDGDFLNEKLQPNILNQMIYTRAGNLQVSTDYESTNQREINLNRKVHINLNNTAPSVGTIAGWGPWTLLVVKIRQLLAGSVDQSNVRY